MKIEMEIFEIQKGQLTKVKHQGNIYSMLPIKTHATVTTKSITDRYQPSPIRIEKETPKKQEQQELFSVDKGKFIDSMGHNQIYENILNEVTQAYESDKSDNEIMNLFKKYYPKDKQPQKQSLHVYKSSYIRYIKRELKDKSHTDQSLLKPKVSPTDQSLLKPKVKHKRRKKMLPGQLGVDTAYGTRIFQDDVNKVKKAIGKWNEIHNAIQIKSDSGMKQGKLNAVLHWMKTHGQVKRTLTSEHGYLYELIN